MLFFDVTKGVLKNCSVFMSQENHKEYSMKHLLVTRPLVRGNLPTAHSYILAISANIHKNLDLLLYTLTKNISSLLCRFVKSNFINLKRGNEE